MILVKLILNIEVLAHTGNVYCGALSVVIANNDLVYSSGLVNKSKLSNYNFASTSSYCGYSIKVLRGYWIEFSDSSNTKKLINILNSVELAQ